MVEWSSLLVKVPSQAGLLMQDSPLYQLESVGYEQYGTSILKEINWTVRHGQHWAILGPNGSGKSTLLKIATGYHWHTSGRLLRDGIELKDLGKFRREIGWISADIINIIPKEETALETVVSGKFAQFGLKYLQSTTPTKADFERAAEELARIDCPHLSKQAFAHLSQGERQQVLIARTRMAGPTLLVLDEPCAGMDPGVRERFLTWLQPRLIDSEFPTVLFTTHHVEEVLPGFEHSVVMLDGKIHSQGVSEEVITQDNLEFAYRTTIAEIREVGGRRWPVWDTSQVPGKLAAS